jgi:glycosyltransferase involved in cell wall biosynthesis/CBS domain-containing protein
VTEVDSYFQLLFNIPVLISTNLEVPILSPSDPVYRLFDLFVVNNVGAVIIVEDEVPIGIVTERDIIERVLKQEKDIEKIKVREIMTTPLITIEADKSIREAIDLLRTHNLRRLVVTKNNTLIGLTTERRLLNLAHTVYLDRTKKLRSVSVDPVITKPIVAYLSTYPPRECGIATFTEDLVDSINKQQALSPPIIVAINDKGGYYNYPVDVKLQIQRESQESFQTVARKIKNSSIDVVNIQHEYGLFGGNWGDYLTSFMEEVDKPIVTTLHTILPNPPSEAKRVMSEVLRQSNLVIVLARVGAKILEEYYDTLSFNVRYIPHGCPNVPFIKSLTAKKGLDLENRYVLSTFGLLSKGKGIEYAIQALPDIVEIKPDVLYLIIGETHPEVRKREGETYRQSLYYIVSELGLEKNVSFVNRFLSKNDLIRFLQATDTYILPYPNKDQISSGTMLYALCTGKAIVTTPFLHAEEVINEGAAVGCKFRDPSSIARNIKDLIDSENLKDHYERQAYQYTRDKIWPNVAMRYINEFYKTLGM